MTSSSPTTLQRYLRTPEAAKMLGLSERTLEKHRVYNTGPMYLKLGGRVVYKLEDLTWWANQTRRRSTHDTSTGHITPTTRRPNGPPRETPA